MRPYGNENFKTLPLLQLVTILFQPNLFYIFPVTVLTKLAYRNFKLDFFLKRLKFSLTWHPMGVKISKRYSSHKFDSFSTKLFLNVPCNNPRKTCFLEFEVSIQGIFRKLTLCPMGKCKIANNLERASRRAKGS